MRRAQLGLFALLVMSIHWLALGTVLVSKNCFESYCRVFDTSRQLAGLETLTVFGPVAFLLIVDYRAVGREKWQWIWQMWANRAMLIVGFGYIALYVVALRAPWLVGDAGGTDRVTVWTARLSSAYAGAPVLAFALALGLAAQLWSVAGACLRALGALSDLDGTWLGRHRGVLVMSLCILDFVVAFATITAFAAGGSI